MSARGVRERIQPPRANLRFAATTTDSNESRPCTRNAMRNAHQSSLHDERDVPAPPVAVQREPAPSS